MILSEIVFGDYPGSPRCVAASRLATLRCWDRPYVLEVCTLLSVMADDMLDYYEEAS
jgi:hypothetical protein